MAFNYDVFRSITLAVYRLLDNGESYKWMDEKIAHMRNGNFCSPKWLRNYLWIALTDYFRGIVCHVVTVIWAATPIILGMIILAFLHVVLIVKGARMYLELHQEIASSVTIVHAFLPKTRLFSLHLRSKTLK